MSDPLTDDLAAEALPRNPGPDDPLHESYLRGYLKLADRLEDAAAAGVIRLLVEGVRGLRSRCEAAGLDVDKDTKGA